MVDVSSDGSSVCVARSDSGIEESEGLALVGVGESLTDDRRL